MNMYNMKNLLFFQTSYLLPDTMELPWAVTASITEISVIIIIIIMTIITLMISKAL